MLPECQLFGTLGCHLCEVAEAVLMPFVDHGLLVELVDIAENETLFERYGLIIRCCAVVTTAPSCTGRSMPNRWWRFSRSNCARGGLSLLHGVCSVVMIRCRHVEAGILHRSSGIQPCALPPISPSMK